MKNRILIVLLISFLPLQPFAQVRISGTVIDKQSKQPVDYASVYINGTTNGTLTDSVGNFHLHNVRFPCILVVSHLSYITHSMEIENPDSTSLTVSLKLRMNEIKEVNVQDKNLREENMNIFRNEFLGTDVWGKYAVIENEEVIQFSRDYITEEVEVTDKKLNFVQRSAPDLQWSPDSTMITYSRPVNLKAKSLLPLKINLPLLGYTLYYDLVGFVYKFKTGIFDADLSAMIGYSYFIPDPYKTKRDSIRILKNREKAYYNSSQHFCRSLYDNKLAQNGYRLLEYNSKNLAIDHTASKFYYSDNAATVDKNSLPTFKRSLKEKEVRLDTCIHNHRDYINLTGLKDKAFYIHYYSATDNKPKDLTLYKATTVKISEIIFTEDTCKIRKDGTVPDNSIVFGKEIGLKKVGSMLPGDYQPSK